jgi:hypothetical protein
VKEAEARKIQLQKDNEADTSALREKLAATEQTLKTENELLAVLEHHKHVLQAGVCSSARSP